MLRSPITRRPVVLAAIALAGMVAAPIAASVAATPPGRIGPKLRILNNGRKLSPAGKLVNVGQFPTGGAVTPSGRFYWTVSTGRGLQDLRVISLKRRKVIQTIPIPGASGGIVMHPTQPLVYVSGVPDSDDGHRDQQRPGLPGRDGDVVHVYRYSKRTGTATELAPIPVKPPALTAPPQAFPPTETKARAWPDRLAISRDGARLLVPLNLADSAAIVDLRTRTVKTVPTGNYPYGAAILRDGKTGLVSNETPGTVSVIDLDKGQRTKQIQVGSHLSHPEAIAVDPNADRAYVAIANADQVAVIDTRSLTVERTLSVERSQGIGVSPTALAVDPAGTKLYVAESGGDEIAVFRLPRATSASARAARARRRVERVLAHEAAVAAKRDGGSGEEAEEEAEEQEAAPAIAARSGTAWELIGRIPTAQYPSDVQVVSRGAKLRCDRKRRKGRRARSCSKLVYLTGKGLGTGPNPKGPDPYEISDGNSNDFQYLPLLNKGKAGVLDVPSTAKLRSFDRTANRQITPSNPRKAPAGTPLRAGGPIKHVFYVVRENRTYDQVLGDVAKGDGEPGLAIFGKQVTPNMHALVDRFPLVDHVYANSEASIDGHFWASAAKVSDYVNKNWFQNYAGRGRPYDFGIYAVTWPSKGFLFDQAERQGISYFNYGEAIAGVVPLTDKDKNAQDTANVSRKLTKSDIGAPVGTGCYPNDAYIGKNALTQNVVYDATPPPGAPLTAESRFNCFKQRFNTQLLGDDVPAFNYMVLTNDHTLGGRAGERTPRAMVADNDLAVGQIVDAISHSKIWKSSAIFVIEDDSQDGADHVDAHRIPAAVISPYAKRGAVVHTRYDFLSVIRSMELILGMKPLGLFDAVATPMYEAFDSSPANAEAFSVRAPTWDRNERNPKAGVNAARSAGLNLDRTDSVPQRTLDELLWKSVHGEDATPPPPGPNNSPGG